MSWFGFGKKSDKGKAKQEGIPDELRGGGNPNADARNALQRGKGRARKPANNEGKVYGSQHVIPMEAFQDPPHPSS